MGEAARAETERWDWKAATSVLRNLQYTRAERRFAQRQEWWSNAIDMLTLGLFKQAGGTAGRGGFNLTTT